MSRETVAEQARTRSLMALTVLSATIALQACGGGGGDAGAPAAAPPATSGSSAAGDYYVYQNTTTTTVPSASSATTYSTVAFRAVNSDGSTERIATSSSALSLAALRYQTSSGAQTSTAPLVNGIAAYTCTNSPAVQLTPTTPRTVSQAWSQTWTQNCTGGTTLTSSGSHSGQVTALEDSVIALGTYPSYRALRTGTVTTSANVTTTTETCWYSTTLIANVRCVIDTTITPVGSSTPSSVTSTDSRLIGYGGTGKTPVGNRVAQFAGVWRVVYIGAASGTCASVTISSAGAVSGSCTATAGSFTITGTVTETGALAVNLSTGGTLSGTLATPYSGSGSWAEGSTAGTWTATHN